MISYSWLEALVVRISASLLLGSALGRSQTAIDKDTSTQEFRKDGIDSLGMLLLELHLLAIGNSRPIFGMRRGRDVTLSDDFWERLLYGTKGDPRKRKRRIDNSLKSTKNPSLRKLFDQLDTDKSGYLSLKELTHGLKVCGIRDVEYDTIFRSLDANDDQKVSFEEFDSGLEPGLREWIEARLNKDGLLNSLYLRPEDSDPNLGRDLWAERVEFEAMRDGSSFRQQEILMDQIRRDR